MRHQSLPLFVLLFISHHSSDAILRGSHEHPISSQELGTVNKKDFEYLGVTKERRKPWQRPNGTPFQSIKDEINELSKAVDNLTLEKASKEALNTLETKLDDSLKGLNHKIEQLTNTCCSNNGSNCVISDGNGMNSLELKGECWTKVKDILQAGIVEQCLDNEGKVEFQNNEMTLWGSGSRHGNVVFPSYQEKIIKFDFAETSTYAKWKAVKKDSCSYEYAWYLPHLLWIHPSQDNDELHYCGTNSPDRKSIATPPLHSTHHSFSGSVKIDFDTWYYTTMTVDTTGDYIATTCTTDYSCKSSESDFVSEDSGVADAPELIGTMIMQLADNYCGKNIGVTVTEFKTSAALQDM